MPENDSIIEWSRRLIRSRLWKVQREIGCIDTAILKIHYGYTCEIDRLTVILSRDWKRSKRSTSLWIVYGCMKNKTYITKIIKIDLLGVREYSKLRKSRDWLNVAYSYPGMDSRGVSTSSLSHFVELYGATSVAHMWFSIALSLLLIFKSHWALSNWAVINRVDRG